MDVWMYVCIFQHVSYTQDMQSYIYNVYIYMYVCMYICMYVCVLKNV